MTVPMRKIPEQGVMKFTVQANFYSFMLRLSDLCSAVEKKRFKEIMIFHSMTYLATL